MVAGLRSPRSASAGLLRAALRRELTPVLSVAMVLEYESVCHDPRHRMESGLRERHVHDVIDALCAVCVHVESRYQWRPQLRDPNDEIVLEAAINGKADALVTFNAKDFGGAQSRIGISIRSPGDALRRIRTVRT